MAKGKQAALAAKRQHAAAMEHLSAVTDELADLKVRTRDAEARAFHAEQRAKNAERHVAADQALVEQCAELIEARREVRRRNLAQWESGAKGEFLKMVEDIRLPMDLSHADTYEFLVRRYPRLFAYMAKEREPELYRERNMHRLTEERVRQLGRALGKRARISWDPERDAADVMNDVLDMHQMDFTREDMIEYFASNEAKK